MGDEERRMRSGKKLNKYSNIGWFEYAADLSAQTIGVQQLERISSIQWSLGMKTPKGHFLCDGVLGDFFMRTE
jgi:hypothetical protein